MLVLEFSVPEHAAVRASYRLYLHKILPRLSRLITANKNAYQYLGASIENFPSGSAMCSLIEANGFTRATAEPLTGGIVTVYTATTAVISSPESFWGKESR